MTATYEVPKRVAENIAKRHAADTHATRCIYGCRAHARLYPCGARCDEHSPWYLAGQPDPATQIDPARTVDGLRARRGDEPETVRAIRAQFQTAPTDTLTERFVAFDAANPHVRERLVELVEWHVSQGARRLGIGALFEELRGKVETTGRHYALDNSLRAPYVRALIADRPEWSDLFELRQRKAS